MRRATTLGSALVLLALSSMAVPASAQPPPAPDAEPDDGPPGPAIVIAATPPEPEAPAPRPAVPHTQHFSAGLGFRAGIVSGEGYDPFSKDNALASGTLFGSYTPFSLRPASLHLAFEWDFASPSSSARGNESSLEIQRLGVGLEARYSPISRLALFVRGMPSAIHTYASIDDAVLGKKLESSSWTWGLDVSGGAAARIGAVGSSEYPVASFWLALDMGYRFAGSTKMRLRPGDLGEEDQTRRFGEVPLPNLDLSGFIARLSGSVSF